MASALLAKPAQSVRFVAPAGKTFASAKGPRTYRSEPGINPALGRKEAIGGYGRRSACRATLCAKAFRSALVMGRLPESTFITRLPTTSSAWPRLPAAKEAAVTGP